MILSSHVDNSAAGRDERLFCIGGLYTYCDTANHGFHSQNAAKRRTRGSRRP